MYSGFCHTGGRKIVGVVQCLVREPEMTLCGHPCDPVQHRSVHTVSGSDHLAEVHPI